jgi:hypothetical protein
VILMFAPRYIWWLLPVLGGMVLAVPLTMLTSGTGAGLWLRRHRLLLTPEEVDPPAELAALEARLAPGASPVGETEVAGEPLPAVPEHVPLPMQVQPARYLTARDALRFRRWKSVNSTPAP